MQMIQASAQHRVAVADTPATSTVRPLTHAELAGAAGGAGQRVPVKTFLCPSAP